MMMMLSKFSPFPSSTNDLVLMLIMMLMMLMILIIQLIMMNITILVKLTMLMMLSKSSASPSSTNDPLRECLPSPQVSINQQSLYLQYNIFKCSKVNSLFAKWTWIFDLLTVDNRVIFLRHQQTQIWRKHFLLCKSDFPGAYFQNLKWWFMKSEVPISNSKIKFCSFGIFSSVPCSELFC